MTYENAVKLIERLEGSTFTNVAKIGIIISQYAGRPAMCYDSSENYAAYELNYYETIVRVHFNETDKKIHTVTVDE